MQIVYEYRAQAGQIAASRYSVMSMLKRPAMPNSGVGCFLEIACSIGDAVDPYASAGSGLSDRCNHLVLPMVICDSNSLRIASSPPRADAPLVIDAYPSMHHCTAQDSVRAILSIPVFETVESHGIAAGMGISVGSIR